MVGCGAVLTWPLMDCIVFPIFFQWAIEGSRASLGDVTYSDVPRPADGSPVVLPLRSEEWEGDGSRGRVYVLAGPPLSGKTSAIHHALIERDHIYISCRGFVEGSEVLYGTMSSILKPLGLLGGAIMAYNKLFNAMGDFITMNQQHLHITHIILAQNMQFVRYGLTRLREKRRQQHEATETMQRRPLVVLDHYEELLELLRHSPDGSDMKTFPLLLTNFLLRWSIDESLCDVLVVCDDRYVKRHHASAQGGGGNVRQVPHSCGAMGNPSANAAVSELELLVPQLASRAAYLHLGPAPRRTAPLTTLPLKTSIALDSAIASISDVGVAPGVLAACLSATLSPSTRAGAAHDALAVVPAHIAAASSLSLTDVVAACELLCRTGVFHCGVGVDVRGRQHLGGGVPQPPLFAEEQHEWYSAIVDRSAIEHLLQCCSSVELLMETPDGKRHVLQRQSVALRDLLPRTGRRLGSWWRPWSASPCVVLSDIALDWKRTNSEPCPPTELRQQDGGWVRLRGEGAINSLRNGDVVRTSSHLK
jgi:hypothetical protein